MNNSSDEDLQRDLIEAIERAEKAAEVAVKAAKKAKKALKKVEKTKLKIKASKKSIIALQKYSDEKSDLLRDELIEIASKAAKKNKALKKIAKMNLNKEED